MIEQYLGFHHLCVINNGYASDRERKFDFKRDANLQKSHQRHGNEVGIEMQKSYQTTITFEMLQRERQGARGPVVMSM